MARETIYRGEDKIITLTITKNGVAYNFDLSAGMVIVLYEKISGKVFSKFSLNTLSGYQTITPLTPTTTSGKCQINILRDTLESVTIGDIDAEIKEAVTVSDFEDSQFRTIKSGIDICTLKNSRTGASDEI